MLVDGNAKAIEAVRTQLDMFELSAREVYVTEAPLEDRPNVVFVTVRCVRLNHAPSEAECAARAVVSHWNEFGPEHGFEETVDRLEKALGQATNETEADKTRRESSYANHTSSFDRWFANYSKQLAKHQWNLRDAWNAALREMLLHRDEVWSRVIGAVIGYDAGKHGSMTPAHAAENVRDLLRIASPTSGGVHINTRDEQGESQPLDPQAAEAIGEAVAVITKAAQPFAWAVVDCDRKPLCGPYYSDTDAKCAAENLKAYGNPPRVGYVLPLYIAAPDANPRPPKAPTPAGDKEFA